MRHRLHYVGKNPDYEDLGQETLTLADIATEEEDDMIGPAAVIALKGGNGNEVGVAAASHAYTLVTFMMFTEVRRLPGAGA